MKIVEIAASDNPVFYSALSRAVAAIPQNKAPGSQWANMIANLGQKGVRQAEIQWSGILDYLQDQPGPVTRDQILQYLQQNEVQVQHVIHGLDKDHIPPDEQAGIDHGPVWDQNVEKLRQLRKVYDDTLYGRLHSTDRAGPPDDTEIRALEKQQDELHARMVADTMKRQGYSGRGPQYKDYSLPGGTDYREMLLTTPPKKHEIQIGEPQPSGANYYADMGKDPHQMNPEWEARWHGHTAVKGVQEMPFQIGTQTGTITYWPETYDHMQRPAGPKWIVNSTFLQNGHFNSLEDAKTGISERYNEPSSDMGYAGRSDVYRGKHWAGNPNVLAHVRFDTRTDAEGKKVLHVLEVQSDWHQEGRRLGYQGDPVETPTLTWKPSKNAQNPTAVRVLGNQVHNLQNAYDASGTEWGNVEYTENGEWTAYVYKTGTLGRFATEDEAKQAVADAVADKSRSKQVAAGPLKKEWPSVAMRRILRYAAEKGFDRVTWDMGETAVNRFDLSSRIGRIDYEIKTGNLKAWAPKKQQHQQPVINKANVGQNELPEYIGKELADKLINDPTEIIQNSEYFGNTHVVSGVDIKVGGEGMRGFYDQILPTMMNKFGKKFGAHVFQTKIDTANNIMKEPSDPDAYVMPNKRPRKRLIPAWGIDITPEMQQSILYGMPLWEQRETSHASREQRRKP